MKQSVLYLLLFACLQGLVGCKPKSVTGDKQVIMVSILPQKYLVEQICGEKFKVKILLPPGANHETYEPTPRDIANLEGASIYFSVGYLDFELNWLPRFASVNSGLKVINTSKGISLIEGHHDEHNMTGKGIDPHTWLSPANARIQAQSIARELIDSDTANAGYYRQNLTRFEYLADSIDRKVRTILSKCEGKPFLIFHPALAYFAREYNLQQISIEFEGKEPSAARIRTLIDMAREKNIRSILISREFDTRNAEAIASEIHAKVIIFDPMAADWPGNLIQLAEMIAEKQ